MLDSASHSPLPSSPWKRWTARELASAALLLGIGAMLASTIVRGTLPLYINPLLAPLVYLSLALLALYLGALSLGQGQPVAEACAAGCCGPPARRRVEWRQWLSLAVLSVPVLAGLLVPPQVLGSAAIGSQDLAAPAVAQTASSFDMNNAFEPAGEEPDPRKRNILQWRRVISGTRDPVATLAGQPVDLIGFVYRAPGDGPGQFTLARFVIRCCVADARPLGLAVVTPEAERLQPDTWVRVQGVLAPAPTGGQQALVIRPERIEPISPPSTPYINGLT